jgi:hypothetical protein
VEYTFNAHSITGILILISITVLPVMFAAKFIGAGNSGFFPALVATIVASVLSFFGLGLAGGGLLGFIVAIIITGLTFMFILKASFGQSIGITFVAFVLQIATFFASVSAGLISGSEMGVAI